MCVRASSLQQWWQCGVFCVRLLTDLDFSLSDWAHSQAVHTETKTPSDPQMSSHPVCQMCVPWANNKHNRAALLEISEFMTPEEIQKVNLIDSDSYK